MLNFEQCMSSWSFLSLVLRSFGLTKNLLLMVLRPDSLSIPTPLINCRLPVTGSTYISKNCVEENLGFPVPEIVNLPERVQQPERVEVPAKDGRMGVKGAAPLLRKRPTRLVLPESHVGCSFDCMAMADLAEKEIEVEGSGFFLASRRGTREVMEDGYKAITDVFGDSKQAFFGVFDGHGGREAVDFVVEKLGSNTLRALKEFEMLEDHLELSIRSAYLTTDREFLSKGISSGACVATVLVKNGELLVANAGDCRVVLSRKGVAEALTCDHRVEREDERLRIENSGGYVNCQNGVCRVQGSLSISRAIGDLHLKEWIISEPETNKVQLTSDCELLIMASDGLWDKVTNQEAVDVVLAQKNSIEACKKLVDVSSSRGNRDDITVMVVDLKKFT